MKPFPMLPYRIVLGVLGLVAAAPVFTWIYGLFLATSHGCDLNIVTSGTCRDGGPAMESEALGWATTIIFLLGTIPLAGAGAVIWGIVLLIHRAIWKRRNAASAGGTA